MRGSTQAWSGERSIHPPAYAAAPVGRRAGACTAQAELAARRRSLLTCGAVQPARGQHQLVVVSGGLVNVLGVSRVAVAVDACQQRGATEQGGAGQPTAESGGGTTCRQTCAAGLVWEESRPQRKCPAGTHLAPPPPGHTAAWREPAGRRHSWHCPAAGAGLQMPAPRWSAKQACRVAGQGQGQGQRRVRARCRAEPTGSFQSAGCARRQPTSNSSPAQLTMPSRSEAGIAWVHTYALRGGGCSSGRPQ